MGFAKVESFHQPRTGSHHISDEIGPGALDYKRPSLFSNPARVDGTRISRNTTTILKFRAKSLLLFL
jgi:hypothetical protein